MEKEYFTPFAKTIIEINTLKSFRQIALTQFYRIERNAFSLTSNKLRLSVSNALNLIPTFLPLSRAFIVTITILEYILIDSAISLFYIPYTTTVAPGGFREFQPPTNF